MPAHSRGPRVQACAHVGVHARLFLTNFSAHADGEHTPEVIGSRLDRGLRQALARTDRLCADMCVDMFVDVCADTCVDMFVDVCADTCADMSIYMHMDMCMDMCR